MNWIRQDKRLAIYLRDGLACAWCGDAAEDGASLSLDHLKPHSKGGTNHESNLVTACDRCNKSRGNRGVRAFAKVVALYRGTDATNVEAHVRKCSSRSLKAHRAEARELIARRGSAAKALRRMA